MGSLYLALKIQRRSIATDLMKEDLVPLVVREPLCGSPLFCRGEKTREVLECE